MKKLHAYTFYALITPVITLGAGSALAQQPAAQSSDKLQITQRNQDTQPTPLVTQNAQSTERGPSAIKNHGYINTIPTNGMQASNLIGADIKTTNDESVGAVNDLIIDEKGQVVAIVASVGGFLGMGEKYIAIGWDDVTRSGNADDNELQINATREGLMSAPEFKQAD